jgi:hypothetical protein
MKQQLVTKGGGKLSKGILFLEDSDAPHKVALRTKNWQILTLKF